MDLSWKTGQPCPSPCWYGLEIGKSTKEDLLELVPILFFLGGVEEIHSINLTDEFRDKNTYM